MNGIRFNADDGATALEYGMLFAFIVVGFAAALGIFAGDISAFMSAAGGTIAGWATSF